MHYSLPRRLGARSSLVVTGSLALLCVAQQACAVCNPDYEPPFVSLPASTASLDCTVTFHGTTSDATFDCPAAGIPSNNLPECSGQCVGPVGLNPTGVYRETLGRPSGVYTSTDAGQTCKWSDAGWTPSSTDGGFIGIVFSDSNATTLKNWLGGPNFSVTVQCGGMQVQQLQDQSIGQYCVGD